MEKPYSIACEKNRAVIVVELERLLVETRSVLEIGSGTGQHAVYFARHLQHLTWQASDVIDNHRGIKLWVDEAGLDNLRTPIVFDVTQQAPLADKYDAIFMANTLHIMPWDSVVECISKAAQYLNPNGLLIVYGPFNYNGQFTSDSNANFDQWLKKADPARGIRDAEKVNAEAEKHRFSVEEDIAMPANNRLLVWRYSA